MTSIPPPPSEPPAVPPPPSGSIPPPPVGVPLPIPQGGYGAPVASPADRIRYAWQRRSDTDYVFDFWTAFGWTLLTCGIYWFYVMYQLVRRSRDHNARRAELLDQDQRPKLAAIFDNDRQKHGKLIHGFPLPIAPREFEVIEQVRGRLNTDVLLEGTAQHPLAAESERKVARLRLQLMAARKTSDVQFDRQILKDLRVKPLPKQLKPGVDLAQLVLVRVPGRRDALWAAEQALRAGSCHALLAWLRHAGFQDLRRLAVAAEGSRAFVALFRPLQAAGEPSPACLRLALEPGEAGALAVRLFKRRGAPLAAAVRVPVKRPVHVLGRPAFPQPAPGDAGTDRRLGLPVHA